jgi:hypothetical protein
MKCKQAIAELENEVRILSKGRTLTAKCKKLIKLLKEQYTLGTVKVKLSNLRKSLGEGHPALDKLKLTDADYVVLKRGWNSQVVADHRNLRPLSPQELLGRALWIMQDKASSGLALALALALVTGRRTFEVMVCGNFKSVEGREDVLHFSGQAKTRNAPGTRSSYIIPVLIPAPTICKAFKRLRKICPLAGMSSEQFHNLYGKRLHEACTDTFGADFTPKLLRSAYACICAAWFKPSNMTDVVYFSDILGHRLLNDEAADMATALHYQDFYIEDQ